MKLRISSDRFWYDINDEFGDAGGVYILSCDDQHGVQIPIQRLLGTDSDGVIYIGMAQSFLDRVIDLKKSLSPDHLSRNHECGARHKDHVGISTQFPYESLHVKLIQSNNPKEKESSTLKEYIETYGELPPLNRVS